MKETGILYVVATPIGNLADITLRALETLKRVDAIAAEDTRHSIGLLRHYGISKPLIAVHDHNEHAAAQSLIDRLQQGESIALITDAGTPAVSDPGAHVVAAVRAAGMRVTPIPGASALIAALSAAGIANTSFMFIGFLPASSSHRRKHLEALKTVPCTLVFYEAPHRIIESIADLHAILGGERQITFARELTKTYETIYTCPLSDASAWLATDSNQQRGEFVLLVESAHTESSDGIAEEPARILKCLLKDLPLKQAVALATEITGLKKNDLYDYALQLKNQG